MQPDNLGNTRNSFPAIGNVGERLEETRNRVYRLALWKLGNRSDAEDVTQETFVRAWGGMAAYDPSRSFDAWVLRIATNLCIDQIRRRQRRTEMSLDALLDTGSNGAGREIELVDNSHNPERQLLAKEARDGLVRKIGSLPADYRQCLLLWEQELSYEEIAGRLHCPIGTIRSRLRRARARLRRLMES